MDNGTVLEL
jgi:hypothetical protein